MANATITTLTKNLKNEVQNSQKKSCLWDPVGGDINHHNREVMVKTWTEVTENIFWHTLSPLDQRDRVSNIKKKWTNIKVTYVKRKNSQKVSQKYYLSELLQFLSPRVQGPNSDGEHGGGEPIGDTLGDDLEIQSVLLKIACKASNEHSQQDGDLLFLFSLLPSMKTMTAEDENKFKLGILKLESDIKFEHSNHPSGESSSTTT